MSLLSVLRKKVVKTPMAPLPSLSHQCYLVTGASSGSLGFATAKSLLAAGATVIVTKRSQSSSLLSELQQALAMDVSQRLFAYDLDLSQRASVEACVQEINQKHSLDCLINNAGIHFDLMSQWTSPQLSDDGYEIHWRVNYLGTCQLTKGLLPNLLAQAAEHGNARVVNVVSMLHSKGLNTEFFQHSRPYNSWHAYGQSKLGLVHATQYLDHQYAQLGLHSYCLHPGAVFTQVAAKGLHGHPLIENVRGRFAWLEAFFLKTPEEGAQTQLYLATANNNDLTGGGYYIDLALAAPSTQANNALVAERLWQQFLHWCELPSQS